jgi:hypothetical protein
MHKVQKSSNSETCESCPLWFPLSSAKHCCFVSFALFCCETNKDHAPVGNTALSSAFSIILVVGVGVLEF